MGITVGNSGDYGDYGDADYGITGNYGGLRWHEHLQLLGLETIAGPNRFRGGARNPPNAARLRLAARRKPYWRVFETGLHLGYRRTKEGGGSWIARRFIGEGRYLETKIGTADDLQDADGVALRSFADAQKAARDWWRIEQRGELGHAPDDGPYTVAKALEAYFADWDRRGSKGLAKDRAGGKCSHPPRAWKCGAWQAHHAAASRLAY
jgi:hypothetical protein